MKKLIIVMVLIVFSLVAVTPAIARSYHVGRHGHYHHWGVLGLGILTGAMVTSLFYAPSARGVDREPVSVTVVKSAPVIFQRSHTMIQQAKTGDKLVSVTTHTLNVRSGPGLKFSVIYHAYQGNVLTIKGSAPGWLYVQLQTGQFGWVMAQFTSKISSPASG
jgi:uncharacterized protein YgiM (DUF1202 family)